MPGIEDSSFTIRVPLVAILASFSYKSTGCEGVSDEPRAGV